MPDRRAGDSGEGADGKMEQGQDARLSAEGTGRGPMVATFVWLGIAVVFGFIEAAAPALVCLWFCLGAAVAFVVSFFVDNILAQIAVFLVASVAMLLALRPFIRKRTKANPEDALTNSDAYVGHEVVVTQGIPEGAGQTGRVLLADVSWLARTPDGSALPTGTRAKVAQVDSTVLVVEPLA